MASSASTRSPGVVSSQLRVSFLLPRQDGQTEKVHLCQSRNGENRTRSQYERTAIKGWYGNSLSEVILMTGPEKTHPEHPKTLVEATELVLSRLSDEDKAEIASMSEDDLFMLHFGLGMWIRNNLGLWQGNSSLLRDCGCLGDESYLGIHPDTASMVIVKQVWLALRR